MNLKDWEVFERIVTTAVVILIVLTVFMPLKFPDWGKSNVFERVFTLILVAADVFVFFSWIWIGIRIRDIKNSKGR